MCFDGWENKVYLVFRTGEEQLFDLSKDPYELHDLSKAKASGKTLEKMRKAMAGHLQERGEEWVKDGKLVIRNKIFYIVRIIQQIKINHEEINSNLFILVLLFGTLQASVSIIPMPQKCIEKEAILR